jgi:hypothetical protein
MNKDKIIEKVKTWSLLYRTEIVLFVGGFIAGAIIF